MSLFYFAIEKIELVSLIYTKKEQVERISNFYISIYRGVWNRINKNTMKVGSLSNDGDILDNRSHI